MARPRKDQAQAEQVQDEVTEVVQEAVQVEQEDQAQAEQVQTVAMVRHPDFPGKAHSADVHPNEVEHMLAYGWTVKE